MSTNLKEIIHEYAILEHKLYKENLSDEGLAIWIKQYSETNAKFAKVFKEIVSHYTKDKICRSCARSGEYSQCCFCIRELLGTDTSVNSNLTKNHSDQK